MLAEINLRIRFYMYRKVNKLNNFLIKISLFDLVICNNIRHSLKIILLSSINYKKNTIKIKNNIKYNYNNKDYN